MSIIHDALKKTGQPVIGESAKTKKSNTPTVTPIGSGKRASSGWGPLLALAVLVLVAGPFLAPIFYGPAHRQDSAAQGQFAVEQAPLPARNSFLPQLGRKDAGAFQLSGVVYSGEDSYSLINGKVVKQGESIGDAVVERITPSEVVLSRAGDRIVLPVTTPIE